MQERFYSLNTFFKKQFGCRVHKIPLDAGLSCPTRNGTKGKGGCIYCNPYGSGTRAYAKGLSISEQIKQWQIFLRKRFRAKKFMAYFQSYCNTYAPISKLKALYDEAVSQKDIVGLCIGTRPDCINEEILRLIESYTDRFQVWIEYELQSIHNRTLNFIRRGHTYEDFLKAVEITTGRNIFICVHIILGLPGEGKKEMMATVNALSGLPINGIKFHHLYIVKGTPLEKLYLLGKYKPLNQEEFIEILISCLERLRKDIVVQRLMGDPRPQELIAPLWSLKKRETLNLIHKTLEQRDTWQGKIARPKSVITLKENPQTCLPPPTVGQGTGRCSKIKQIF